jgi:2-furoyl-CoA dehydrogenase large subunit
VLLHIESPSPFTPLGAKGVGEGNNMSTPVCIANAVCDALDVEHLDLPLTASKIAAVIHGEERAAPDRDAEAAPARAAPGRGLAVSGTGQAVVAASPETVWETLLDPAKLAAVIPGCHALEPVGDNAFRAEVSLGVGPVRGRFVADIALSDLTPPSSVTLSGGLKGPLGESRGGGHVRLEAIEQGTRVTYDYEVDIGGKVAAVGGRMLEGAARAVVGQFFERLIRQVETPREAAAPSPWRRLLRWLGIGS